MDENVSETQSGSFTEISQRQNFPLGIVCSLLAAILGGVLWATITVITEYQIGYMAVAVGFLVGKVNHFTGKGMEIKFGVVGAVMALLGCVLGNYLSIVGFTANELNLGYFETFSFLDAAIIFDAMIDNFSFFDLLFYGIAGYEGFKFSLIH